MMMNRSAYTSLLAFFFLLLCVVAPMAPGAQVDDPTEEAAFTREVPDLQPLLAELRDAISAGDWLRMDQLAGPIKAGMLRQGISASDEMAELYVRAAKTAGTASEAEQLLATAKFFSPDYPASYLAQASLGFSGFDIARSVDALKGGISAMYRSAREGILALSMVISGIGFLLLAVAVAYSSLLLLRYIPLFSHDLGHRVSALSGYGSIGVSMAILIVPTAFGGLFLFPAAAIVMMWLYQRKREKMVSAVVLVLMALSPLVVGYLSGLNAAVLSPLVRAVAELRKGPLPFDTESQIRGIIDNDPVNREALTILALHERKQGDTDGALKLYQKLEQSGQATAAIFNNMANIYVEQGDSDRAMELYRQAIAQDPSDAMPHFNLSQVLKDRFSFEEGKKEFVKAEALDPELIRYFRDWEGGLTMDEGLKPADLWKVAMSKKTGEKELGTRLGAVLFAVAPPYGIYLLAVAAGLAVVLRGRKMSASSSAFYCGHCGRVSCGQCTTGRLTGSFCSQCLQAFVRRDGVAAKSRMQKILEITRYRRTKLAVGRGLSFVLPGAGHIYLGATVSGVLWMIIVLGAATLAVYLGCGLGGGVILWILVTVALTLYLLSAAHCYRIRRAR